MLNKSMKHFIYKTTHNNGKYYIGRHSTDNLDDGYIGSGKWPLSIKDKSTLTREILEYAESVEELKDLEGKYLAEHYGKPQCMNATKDPIGFDTESNPMKDPELKAKISGNNHWLKKNPERSKEISNRQKERIKSGEHIFVSQDHPMKQPANRKKVSERITQQNLTNNPSTRRAKEGIHQWQNGNSPNAGGKLNKKLVEAGTHNFLGPEHNKRMIAEGKNPWVGSASNLKRLAEGTHPSQQKKTCEHCGKTSSVGMYARWHGDNCKQKG